MNFLKFSTKEDNIKLDKKTLVALRWIAIFGQFFTIAFVFFILKFKFNFFYCFLIIFIGALSNIFLQFYIKRNQLNNLVSTIFLFYDLVQLALLIFFTGGITNPFIILLIIPAIVSSTFLSLISTLNLSFVTVVSLIVLTIYHLPLPHSGKLHFHVPDFYLYAVPIAIIIGLIFLTYFGARFGSESKKRTKALNKLELVLAKEHELKTIGVQAAAAAHSLSTPLSTISVIAKELKKEIGEKSNYSKDINLLLSQTYRCRKILEKLSMVPLKRDSFFENVRLVDLLSEIIRSFQEISKKNFVIILKNNKYNPIVKRKAELTYGLRNFVDNAAKFSNSLVEIELTSNEVVTVITVCDDGPGFPEDILSFIGEPYIHTKNSSIDSKSGLGLGIFIGKTLLERLKANVIFGQSSKTKGAKVSIEWNTNNLVNI